MMAEEGDAYKCGICKKEFKDFVTFLQHKSSLGVYKCKLCNLSFHDRDDIQKHIQAVHVNQKVDVAFTIPTNASIINTKPEPPPSATGTKSGYALAVYTCRLCNRFTTVERSMLLHLQTVHKIHVVPGSVELGALMLCSRPLDSAYTTKLQAALAEGKPQNKSTTAVATIGTQTNMTFCLSQLSISTASNGTLKEDSFAMDEMMQPLDKSDAYTVLSDEVLKEITEKKEIVEGKAVQESKDAVEDKEALEATKMLEGKDVLEVATQEIEMKNVKTDEVLQQEPDLEEIQTEQVILEEIPSDQIDLQEQAKPEVATEMSLTQEITTEEVSPFEDDTEMVVLKSPSISAVEMDVDSEDGKAPKMTSILKKNIITYSRAAMKAAAKNTVVLSAKQQPLPTIDQAHDYIGATPKIAPNITEIKTSEIQINKVFPKVTLLKNKTELFSASSPKKIMVTNSPKPKLQPIKRKSSNDGRMHSLEKKTGSPRPVGRPKLSSYGQSSPSKKQNFTSDEEELPEELGNDPQPGLDGMFHCKHCNRAFARERQYKAHMSVHLMYGEHYLESPGGPQQRKKSKLNI